MAGISGPPKWYVDANVGEYRDSQDAQTGTVLAPVAVPAGATLVTSAPTAQDQK